MGRTWNNDQFLVGTVELREGFSIHTDHRFVVPSDDKKVARLNCIHHLLSVIPYADHDPPVPGLLPPRPVGTGYVRPPREDQTYIPSVYS